MADPVNSEYTDELRNDNDNDNDSDGDDGDPEFETDYPEEVDTLFEVALKFCEQMSRGQKHPALKDTLPNLKIAVKEAKQYFRDE